MELAKLFNTPEMIKSLQWASSVLMAHQKNELPYRLGQVLRIISNNAAKFDEYCQISIQWIGDYVLGEVQAVTDKEGGENIYALTSTIYRFVIEYDLSVKDDLSIEIHGFIKSVLSEFDKFSENEREQIQYSRQEMPIAILKRVINADEIGNIRNVSKIAETVEKRIQGWEGTLEKTEQTTIRLKDALEKHTKEFNFVGLREGFSDLASGVEKELKNARVYMVIFGVLTLLPSAFDILFALGGQVDLTRLNTHVFVLVGVGTVSMTALFLYYFRIALRKADSCTAQLTQIRLRMSLCRFIQSYADYSTEIKGKNSDALSKFEALIFSGIVTSGDKLPSTFDGVEQLTAFAKSITGK
jgi:hypothetical protein